MEHAAKSGDNPNYYHQGSSYYPSWDYPETDLSDEIDSSDSEATASIVRSKLDDLKRRYAGTDLKYHASMMISEYSHNLNDNDLDALARSCGMTVDEIDQYI